MKEGEKIYVESLLTTEEYRECKRKYSTYDKNFTPVFFKSEMMWRYRMGESVTAEEIYSHNKALDFLLTKVNKKT